MPISVVCATCKTRFEVSEKFAGKQGPCPKCKAIIKIPEVMAAEVKVHVPEAFAGGGKDKKGRVVTKPIPRVDTKVNPKLVAAILVGAALTLCLALAARGMANKVPVIALGLLVISPPLAAGAYAFLRDDELEPYRAKELWVRAAICGLGYTLLWAAYWPVSTSGVLTGEMYQWLFVAPVFIGIGGGIAFATFDIDYGSGALHYCFYLLTTLLLRAAIGLPPIWVIVT
jgi:hypothetical protein